MSFFLELYLQCILFLIYNKKQPLSDGNSSTDANPTHLYSWLNVPIYYYTVTLYVTNPCGTDSITYEVGVGDSLYTGVEEVMNESAVMVYPNPSTGNFNVELQDVNNEEVSIQVYDIQGKQILVRNLGVVNGTQVDNIEMTEVSSGVYFMNVTIGEQKEVLRLIVE